jgi:hypothetical protein
LDHEQRHALVGEFDDTGVPKLVRREAASSRSGIDPPRQQRIAGIAEPAAAAFLQPRDPVGDLVGEGRRREDGGGRNRNEYGRCATRCGHLVLSVRCPP